MEIFIWSAILAIIFFAGTSVLAKLLIPDVGGPYSFFVIQSVLAAPLAFFSLYLIEQRVFNPAITDLSVALTFLTATLLGFVGFICLIIGFSKGNASVGGIFLSSRLVINIPLAFIFLQERYPIEIYLLIAATLVGALIVSWDETLSLKEVFLFQGKGVKWFVLTMVFWALANLFTANIRNRISAIEFIAYRQLIFVLMAFLFFPFLHSLVDEGLGQITNRFWAMIIGYVVLLISAQALFVYSLNQSLTITEGIGAMEGVATFLLSVAIAKTFGNSKLEEPLKRQTLVIRSAGVLISTVSVLLIVLLQN